MKFPIHFQNIGIFDTSFMINVVFDPKHVTVSGNIIPFVHINPIPFVGNNLLDRNHILIKARFHHFINAYINFRIIFFLGSVTALENHG